jgi:hypothetical protein
MTLGPVAIVTVPPAPPNHTQPVCHPLPPREKSLVWSTPLIVTQWLTYPFSGLPQKLIAWKTWLPV